MHGTPEQDSPVDFRRLFELLPEPCVVLDRDLRVVAASDAYLRGTGLDRAALLGRSFIELVDRAEPAAAPLLEELRSSFERVLAEGRTEELDLPGTVDAPATAQWSGSWLSSVNSPLSDSSGRVGHILHRVRSIEATDESTPLPDGHASPRVLVVEPDAAFRSIVARMLADAFTVETAGDPTTALAIASLSPPDIVVADAGLPGLGTRALIESIRARLSQRDVPIVLLASRGMGGQRLAGLEWGADDFVEKPFEARELRGRIRVHLELRRLRREREAHRRLAEESDARLRQIAENLDEVLWLEDAQSGRILYVSPSVRDQWGIPADRLLGQTGLLLEVVHPDDRSMVEERLRRGRAARFRVEFRVVLPDGRIRWLNMRGVPILDESGIAVRRVGVSRDVTERRESEERLRRSEERYALAVAGSGVAVWELDPVRGDTFVSDRLEQVVGAPVAPVPHLEGVLELIHPQDRARMLDAIATLGGAPATAALEYRLRTARGWRWMQTYAASTHGEAGRVDRIAGTILDIDDRRRAEQSLRESERRLAAATALVRLGYWERDLLSETLVWSDQLFEIFGIPESEWDGRVESFLARVHPEDRPRIELRVAHAIARREAFQHSYRVVVGGATRHIVEWGRVESDGDGRAVRVFGTAQDVTERVAAEQALRTSEERFRIVAGATSDAVWDWDLRRDILVWSAGFEKLFGHGRDTLPPGLDSWSPFLHPDDAERVLAGLWRAIAERSESWSDIYRFRRADGSWAHVEDRGQVILDGAGRAVRMVGRMIDISERVASEERMRRLNVELEERVRDRTAALEEAVRELDAFSYSVSHDLRAPLRAINGFARILEDEHAERIDAAGRECLDRIRTSTRQMGELIDDLLGFARLQRQPIEMQPVDMQALVEEVLAALRQDLEAQGAKVVVGELPSARGDRAMLRQVWSNLIGNAFKYSRASAAPRIEIDAEPGPCPVYRIRDNGVGFDMRYADKLFVVFQRLHPSEAYEGTGVGLAIVKRVRDRHGGRVWAESAPGEGATFRFTVGGRNAP